jgi:hypothetical protein
MRQSFESEYQDADGHEYVQDGAEAAEDLLAEST